MKNRNSRCAIWGVFLTLFVCSYNLDASACDTSDDSVSVGVLGTRSNGDLVVVPEGFEHVLTPAYKTAVINGEDPGSGHIFHINTVNYRLLRMVFKTHQDASTGEPYKKLIALVLRPVNSSSSIAFEDPGDEKQDQESTDVQMGGTDPDSESEG